MIVVTRKIEKKEKLGNGAKHVRKTPGSNHHEKEEGRSGPVQNKNKEGSNQRCGQQPSGYQSNSSVQPTPLQTFSRVYDEEDIDLYADIEPPT